MEMLRSEAKRVKHGAEGSHRLTEETSVLEIRDSSSKTR